MDILLLLGGKVKGHVDWLNSDLPLRQLPEAGHAGQTAQDPGQFGVLRHL